MADKIVKFQTDSYTDAERVVVALERAGFDPIRVFDDALDPERHRWIAERLREEHGFAPITITVLEDLLRDPRATHDELERRSRVSARLVAAAESEIRSALGASSRTELLERANAVSPHDEADVDGEPRRAIEWVEVDLVTSYPREVEQ